MCIAQGTRARVFLENRVALRGTDSGERVAAALRKCYHTVGEGMASLIGRAQKATELIQMPCIPARAAARDVIR
jgi:hypothetical protein